jgi:hypothetical protein
VEWIGWWVQTPLVKCYELNKRLSGRLPWADELIDGDAELITDQRALPSIEEGFSALVKFDQTKHVRDAGGGLMVYDMNPVLDQVLGTLDDRCAGVATQREGLQQHAYSRPLDFE